MGDLTVDPHIRRSYAVISSRPDSEYWRQNITVVQRNFPGFILSWCRDDMSYNLLIPSFLYIYSVVTRGVMRPVSGQHRDPSPVIALDLSLSSELSLHPYSVPRYHQLPPGSSNSTLSFFTKGRPLKPPTNHPKKILPYF